MPGEETRIPRGWTSALPSPESPVCETHCGSPKYERAVMRWLERYLTEGEPRLQHFAEVVGSLANLELVDQLE
jgi:hypothetical protein